ncbi:MAG: A24 family peptidase [candidate division Zixibacteria bacterium]
MIYYLSAIILRQSEHKLPFRPAFVFLDLLWIIPALLIYFGGISSENGLGVLLLSILFGIVCIADFKFQIIPNNLLVIYSILGIFLAIIPHQPSFFDSILGGIFGFVLFLGIEWIGSIVFRKPAMGGGDIKLAAVLGLFVGWQGIFITLFIGAILGLLYVSVAKMLVVGKKIRTIPFGSFLVFSSIITYWVGDAILDYYINGLLL